MDHGGHCELKMLGVRWPEKSESLESQNCTEGGGNGSKALAQVSKARESQPQTALSFSCVIFSHHVLNTGV